MCWDLLGIVGNCWELLGFVRGKIAGFLFYKKNYSTYCQERQLLGGWNIQGAFGDYSGNIQGSFNEHSGIVQVPFRKHSGIIHLLDPYFQ
jgi:hypothetical protein